MRRIPMVKTMGEAREIRVQDIRKKILSWRNGLAVTGLAVLPEDPDSIPNTHVLALQPCVTLVLRDLMLSGLHRCCTCVVNRHACR